MIEKTDIYKISILELTNIIKARTIVAENASRDITGVSIDSRTVQEGDCFFAIQGENFDGHDYVSDAFNKGAFCAVVSKEFSSEEFTDKCLLKVNDTIEALGDLAREYRRRAGFKVVGITGTAGKTTTRQIIHHALKSRFGVHQSPKSFNNNVGLPLTLLGAGPQVQIVVAELGSNHPGEISYLTHIAAPDIAVVTNVHPAHLEGFGDLKTIAREKLSIAEGLQPDGILIINENLIKRLNDDRLNYQPPVAKKQIKTFGSSAGSDYQIEGVSYEGSESKFITNGTPISLPLAGPGNVENALAAWAVCSSLGLKIEEFAQAVQNLPSVSMRAELIQTGTLTILNDCYNANPASMENALNILANIDPTGKRRLVFICGDMAELGNQAERLHKELGLAIAKTRIELILSVGELAGIAAETAKSNSKCGLKINCFAQTPSACNNLHKFIKDYDIILVKGSRAAGLERIVEKLKEFYS